MKVLFLDIDGVCNSQDTFTKEPEAYFPIDKYMAFLVGKIQLDTGCVVVLSSSWRHNKESVDFINERIVKIFDITPDLPHPNIRGDEIKAWMEKWNKGCFPNPPHLVNGELCYNESITKYAILDDDTDMLPEQFGNVFNTSFKTGLTEEIAKRVTEHLNEKITNQ